MLLLAAMENILQGEGFKVNERGTTAAEVVYRDI